ncbi:MAG: hypothetical protein JJU29_22940 [Verrucomicrobia bacterium]|nr:hypothetical protein [Verrucomicrobiota bacterium]MCH8512750.1 hypothetical protein [Kiritimatiellia bacterium]
MKKIAFPKKFALPFVKITAGLLLFALAGCTSPAPPSVREMPPRIETPVQADPGEIDPAAPHQAPQNEGVETDGPEDDPAGTDVLPENAGGIRYLLNGEPIGLEDLQSGEIPESSTITIMAERHVPYSLVTDALLKIHGMGYLVNFGVEEVSSDEASPTANGDSDAMNAGEAVE